MPKPLLALARDLVVRNDSPVPYAPARSALHSRTATNAGFTTALEAYGAVPQLQALISRWAQDAAQVDWHLYRKRKPGTDPNEPRVEVTTHPAIDVWNCPNPWTTQREFLESSIQHLLITGESDWCIARAGRLPLELWLARPDRMVPVPHATKFLAGWVYEANSERVPLETADVIQVMIPNPSDPYRGLSPIQALMPTLQAADSATKWWLNFFRNGAAPSGALQVEKNLGDEEFDRLTRQWSTQHKGVQNAHRMAILEAGMHYEPVTPTMREMQFTELLNLPGELIRAAFTFPKPLLGAVDDVNRANAEAGAAVYGRYHLSTMLDRYRDAWNMRLLPQWGATARGLEWDFDSPIPEDAADDRADLAGKVEAYSVLVTAGVDPEDAAVTVGLPPMRMRAVTTEPAPDVPPVDDSTAAVLVKAAASLTPAVGKVVTYEEGRGWLNDLGATLDLTAEAPAPPVPVPPVSPSTGDTGHQEPDGDEDENGDEPPGPEEKTPPTARGPLLALPAGVPSQDGAPAGGPPPVDQHDLEAHQADWEAALAGLIAAWIALRAVKITDLVGQVRAALRSGDIMGLMSLRTGDHGGAALVADHLTRLWRRTATAETRQLHAAGFPDVSAPEPHDGLTVAARIVTELLDRDMATTAARVAVNTTPGSVDETTADLVAQTVEDRLNELTDVQPTAELGGALTQVQGQARLEVMNQGPEPAYYASAVLDRSTCPNCASLDGKWIGNTIPEVQVLYPGGQYRACEGGRRCRCQVVATYRSGNKSTSYEKKPVVIP